MAFAVMAYIDMACGVMAYVVMACVVMAYVVIAYVIMANGCVETAIGAGALLTFSRHARHGIKVQYEQLVERTRISALRPDEVHVLCTCLRTRLCTYGTHFYMSGTLVCAHVGAHVLERVDAHVYALMFLQTCLNHVDKHAHAPA